MFSQGSPCLLGQHGSCSTAHRPGEELSENMLQNLGNKLPPQTVVPMYVNKKVPSTRCTTLYVLLDGDNIVGLKVDDGLRSRSVTPAMAQVVVTKDNGVGIGGEERREVAVVVVEVLWSVVIWCCEISRR